MYGENLENVVELMELISGTYRGVELERFYCTCIWQKKSNIKIITITQL